MERRSPEGVPYIKDGPAPGPLPHCPFEGPAPDPMLQLGELFGWMPGGPLPRQLVQEMVTDGAVAARPKRGGWAVRCGGRPLGVIALPGGRQPRPPEVRRWGSDPEDEDVVLLDADGEGFAAAQDVDPDD